MIKIITDSTSDISKKLAEELGVTVVPLSVNFKDGEYVDGVDITIPQFYEKLSKAEELPTTSQVTVGAFQDVFKKALGEDDEVLGIFISSKLSGTFQSALIAAEELDQSRIQLIDTGTVTFGLCLLVLEAARLRDAGKSLAEISGTIKELSKKVCLFAAIDKLKYLQLGGRLSATTAIAGTILGVKPIIQVKDGQILPIHKCRGMKAAQEYISKLSADYSPDTSKPFFFGHSDCVNAIPGFIDMMSQAFDIKEHFISDLGIVVGTHVGPGCVGVAFFSK